jgi:PAS domain S-box-containing protein
LTSSASIPDPKNLPNAAGRTDFQGLLLTSDEVSAGQLPDWAQEIGVTLDVAFDVEVAKNLFKNHALVIIQLTEADATRQSFASWVRMQSKYQPFVLGLGSASVEHRSSFNEIAPSSVTKEQVETFVESARRWQDWTIALHGPRPQLLPEEPEALEDDKPFILLTPATVTPQAELPNEEPPVQDEPELSPAAVTPPVSSPFEVMDTVVEEALRAMEIELGESIAPVRPKPLGELPPAGAPQEPLEPAPEDSPFAILEQEAQDLEAPFSSGELATLATLHGSLTLAGVEFHLVAPDGRLLDANDDFLPGALCWWEDQISRPENEAAAELFHHIVVQPPPSPVWQTTVSTATKETHGVRQKTWRLSPLLDAEGWPRAVLVVAERSTVVAPEVKQPKAPALAKPTETSLHQTITERTPYGLIVLDANADVVYQNPQLESVLGADLPLPSDVGMEAWLEKSLLGDTEIRKTVLKQWWEQIWRRRQTTVLTMQTTSGLLKEIEFRPSALAQGSLLIAIFDITDARREEESVRASEARFRGIFNQTAIGMVLVNPAGNIADANRAFESMAGCSRMDIRRLGIETFFAPEALAQLESHAQLATKQTELSPLVSRFRPRGGGDVPVAVHVSLVRNSNGHPVFTAYQVHPLESTADLKKSPSMELTSPAKETTNPVATTAAMLACTTDLVIVLDSLGRVRSTHGQPLFAGYSLQHPVAGGNVKEFPFLADYSMSSMLSRLAGPELEPQASQTTLSFRMASGNFGQLEARLCRIPGLEPYFLLVRDLTHSQVAPTAQDGQFAYSAISMLKQAAFMVDLKGRITHANRSAEKLFGYTSLELVGKGLHTIFMPEKPKEFTKIISEQLNKHRCWIGKSSFYRKNGTTGRLSVELVPHDDFGHRGFLGLMHEMTEEECAPSLSAAGDLTSFVHRAKNDLQILTSLLSLQAESAAANTEIKSALAEGRDRAAVVATVYRFLDTSKGIVNFRALAQDITSRRVNAFPEGSARITCNVEEELQVPLAHKHALSLGLVMAEVISYVLEKHLPAPLIGSVTVRLETTAETGKLVISDTGPKPTESRPASVGQRVQQALASQLRGKESFGDGDSNEYCLEFPLG